MNLKKSFMFAVMLCAAAFAFAACGGSSSSGGGGDTPTDLGTEYSDDSGLKGVGALAAPPLYINPEDPATNGAVTIVATISGATDNITFTAVGSGCGTIASTTGASPLTVTGTAGTSGYCDITASATLADTTTQTYMGSFQITATDPNIPPITAPAGMWVQGALPAATATGPTITSLTGPAGLMNGSTNTFTINYAGTQNVAGVIVKIDGYDNGYFFIPASGGTGVATFDLSIASDYFDRLSASIVGQKAVASGTQNLIVAIVDALNQISSQLTQSFTTVESQTGDVKVSITWDTVADVDLHVTEPDGNEIGFDNKGPSSTGGELDIDSYAACSSEGSGVENIFWPVGQSPQGAFAIRVHMWSNMCGPDGTAIPSTGVTLTYQGCGEEFVNGPITDSFSLGATNDEQSYSFNSLCSYSVAGTVKYEKFVVDAAGRSANGTMVPVRYATVKVLRASDDAVLGEAKTGLDGKYEIQFTNDGEHGYYVQVYATSGVAPDTATVAQEVKSLNGALYAFRSATDVDESVEPVKTAFDINVMEADNAGALNIWDVGVRSNAYTRSITGVTPEKVTFYWTKGSKPAGKMASFYSSGAAASPLIAILSDPTDEDEYDDMVIAHEYGHFVMSKYSTDNSPGGTHYIDAYAVPTLALSEGWATFFAGSVFRRSTYMDSNAGGMGVSYSFETIPASITDKAPGTQGAVLDGNVNEVVVNAVLWDLADASNETKDTLNDNATAVWTIFTTYLKSGYASFVDRGYAGRDLVDFLDGWICLGYENLGTDTGATANKTGVRGNVIGLHGLTYDFPTLASCK